MASFQSDGLEPEVRDVSNMIAKMGVIRVLHSSRTLPCISSGPLALGVDIFQEIFNTVNMDTDVIHLRMSGLGLYVV